MLEESLLDYLLLVLGSVLGWFVKIGHTAHKELAKEVNTNCVKKEDFKDALRDLKDSNAAIFAKLDRQDTKLDSIQTTLAGKADRSELGQAR